MNISRRHILQYGLAGLSSTFIPFRWSGAQVDEDHFLYVLFLNGAADFNYLFDSRPLSMTQKNLIANHLGEEPSPWFGNNGQACLASAITKPLLPFKNDLTIINGVFVDKTFDSHTNMIDLFFSGSPFGGSSFAPWLNTKSVTLPQLPLDGLKKNGNMFFTTDSHHATLVELNSTDTTSLIEELKFKPQLSTSADAWTFALERMNAGSLLNPQGQWSQGSLNLYNNLQKGQNLALKLGALDMSAITPDTDLNFLDLFRRMVQEKMTRLALESTTAFGNPASLNYDSHAFVTSDEFRNTYKLTVEKIAKTLHFFKNTAYDNTRSLFDVTTVVIATEFGRTMRQQGLPIESTGTDHNTLCNSVLMAGKGIRGGQVIGSSDFEVYDEILSGAHLELDPLKIKVMAKPFDFSEEKSVLIKPTTFVEEHYLHVNNVINTLFELFGLPKDLYRRKNVGSNPYAVIRSLLK